MVALVLGNEAVGAVKTLFAGSSYRRWKISALLRNLAARHRREERFGGRSLLLMLMLRRGRLRPGWDGVEKVLLKDAETGLVKTAGRGGSEFGPCHLGHLPLLAWVL